MSSAIKILPHYTYEDYERWEGSWELIDGIPHAMSPAPIPKHQIISLNIASEFRNALKNCNCRAVLPIDYKINDDTILQPDILIICKEVTKKYLDFPPSLIVEVLSPATVVKDKNTKYQIYQDQGVKYYLMVDIEKDLIEVYELKEGKYALIQNAQNFSHQFRLNDNCEISIDFSQVWAF